MRPPPPALLGDQLRLMGALFLKGKRSADGRIEEREARRGVYPPGLARAAGTASRGPI